MSENHLFGLRKTHGHPNSGKFCHPHNHDDVSRCSACFSVFSSESNISSSFNRERGRAGIGLAGCSSRAQAGGHSKHALDGLNADGTELGRTPIPHLATSTIYMAIATGVDLQDFTRFYQRPSLRFLLGRQSGRHCYAKAATGRLVSGTGSCQKGICGSGHQGISRIFWTNPRLDVLNRLD